MSLSLPLQCMLDLETLGTRPGSVVAAIGAVLFDSHGIAGEFSANVDFSDAVACGLTIDPATVQWWLKQSKEAQLALCAPGGSLDSALDGFRAWLPPGTPVWGNGADFDQPLLAEAYRRRGQREPWSHKQSRCYRTMAALFPQIPRPQMPRAEAHCALADAKHQALHLSQILRHFTA